MSSSAPDSDGTGSGPRSQGRAAVPPPLRTSQSPPALGSLTEDELLAAVRIGSEPPVAMPKRISRVVSAIDITPPEGMPIIPRVKPIVHVEQAPPGVEGVLARIGVAAWIVEPGDVVTGGNEAAVRLLGRGIAPEGERLDEVLHVVRDQIPRSGDVGEGALDPTEATGWIERPDGQVIGICHVFQPKPNGTRWLFAREVASTAVFAPAIARRARYDPLTGLYSRRGLIERIDQALAESRKVGTEHALCYLDLDRFRLVNTTCGHEAGDDLLQWVATRLYEVLGPDDAAARIAGDEFAILLLGQPDRDPERVAKDIQQRLRDFRFGYGHKTFLIETSMGLARFGAEQPTADDTISAAAHACRSAKKAGGGRLHVLRDETDEVAQSRRSMDWIAGIQHHISDGKLILYAQPIRPMTARAHTAAHFEILMRVVDDDGRPSSPVGIIQAAENGRMMDAIDRFVVKKAFQTIGALPRRALRNLELFSVNLSGISLSREGLLDYLVEQLERSAVPPGKVCFEITETAALANLDEVRWLIQELGAMGCRFAIDDFGSGHASYGYIERLPVDYVKIDGMFVRDMLTNGLHRAIVESVHRIATTLGIKTVAECVETQEIASVLAGMGVHYGQGWYFARPAPIMDVCRALSVDE